MLAEPKYFVLTMVPLKKEKKISLVTMKPAITISLYNQRYIH